MSAKSSEVMLDLLKELALLKEMDQLTAEAPPSTTERTEFEARQRRRNEIEAQIKALGSP